MQPQARLLSPLPAQHLRQFHRSIPILRSHQTIQPHRLHSRQRLQLFRQSLQFSEGLLHITQLQPAISGLGLM